MCARVKISAVKIHDSSLRSDRTENASSREREKKFVGGGVRYKVREGDVELGRLSNGSFFVIKATPGTHEYTVHSEAKDILTLEVESGETYYVVGGVTVGVVAGRPNLSPSDAATFEALKDELKDVTGQGIDND
jgi:hypothetical protein